MKERTVCFTGHRLQKFGDLKSQKYFEIKIKKLLKKEITLLIQKGFDTFISGGALGVDQWAAEVILELQSDFNLTLIIAKPFPSQESIWPKNLRDHFKNICLKADKVITVNPDPYSSYKMQKRNEYMVCNSKVIIAVWDGSFGGTANTVNYGIKKGIEIIRINPFIST